ncbi:MAG: ABC transporter permease [Candidatus Pelethousia sp.]|nr:ABC transporter permease [Candidatus Pelethousia sp.]
MKKIDTVVLKATSNNILRQSLVSLSAIVIALVLGMAMIAFMDISPFKAFAAMAEGAFGNKNSFAETIVKMTPLLFTGMSYALANRCGLTNLGMEGQMYIGALFSSFVGIYATGIPAAVHIPLCIMAGFIGGGIWCLITGMLKVRFEASEIITTVMLNTVAINLIEYMVTGPMMEPPGVTGQSSPVLESARLGLLIPGTRAHWGFILGILFIFLFWLFLWKVKRGYEVRVSGFNSAAALYSGINTDRNILLITFLAGGLAGLAGAVEVLGVQGRLYSLFSPGYGYDGIAVALIGMNSPLGIVVGALLFGAFRAGGNRMQMRARVPDAIVNVMQAFVIIAVVASQMLLEIWNERRMKQQKQKEG